MMLHVYQIFMYIFPGVIIAALSVLHTQNTLCMVFICNQVQAGDLFVNDSLHNWVPWFKISQL